MYYAVRLVESVEGSKRFTKVGFAGSLHKALSMLQSVSTEFYPMFKEYEDQRCLFFKHTKKGVYALIARQDHPVFYAIMKDRRDTLWQ